MKTFLIALILTGSVVPTDSAKRQFHFDCKPSSFNDTPETTWARSADGQRELIIIQSSCWSA